MHIQELIKQTEADRIIEEILNYYPHEKERVHSNYYHHLIQMLCQAEIPPNRQHVTVHVDYSKDFGKNNPSHIWGVSYSVNKRYHHKYSLYYLTINEIAGALVFSRDLEHQRKEEYIAHLLYEIAQRDLFEDDNEFVAGEPSNKKSQKEYCLLEELLDDDDE